MDQRLNELQNRRLHEIEILDVDLGRVQARPGACDTATVFPGLFAAHDLYAVRKETLGGGSGTPLGGCCSMHFAQLIEKRMGLAVSVCVRLISSHLDLRRVEG
jgi:hypothetical protein